MTTKIDRFGRIVIPKELRDELGLAAGSEVELEGVERSVIMRPVDSEPPLRLKDGILVYTGKISDDASQWVRRLRDARARKILGLD